MISQVKKIAVLNSYLQGGHRQIAESESVVRFIKAANNLGIEAVECKNNIEVNRYHPDIVVSITYQEGKLTKYPTYIALNTPTSFLNGVPRFIRNLLSFDGFLTLSPSVRHWLQELGNKHQKSMHITEAAFSVPRQQYVEIDFKKSKAMYVGTNWDGTRHADLFKKFEKTDTLKCYGPEKSWASYNKTLYGGLIPFDGDTIFKKYQRNGIGLCIGHSAFDNEGIANSRIFEISASSAISICSQNPLIRELYGDSVLYLSGTDDTQRLFEEIELYTHWIRSNSRIAKDMARAAHEIFNKNASMESYISRIIALHQQVMLSKCHSDASIGGNSPKITYIVFDNDAKKSPAIIDDLISQTYKNLSVVFVSENDSSIAKKKLDESSVPYLASKWNFNSLMENIHLSNPDYLSLLQSSQCLYPEHTSVVGNYLHKYQDGSIKLLLTGTHETTKDIYIEEVVRDIHSVPYQNTSRLMDNSGCLECYTCSLFLSPDNGDMKKLARLLLAEPGKLHKLTVSGSKLKPYTAEITCSINLWDQLDEAQWVEDSDQSSMRTVMYSQSEEIKRLSKELLRIHNSLSWKLSIPLRILLRLVSYILKIMIRPIMPGKKSLKVHIS